MSEFDQDFIDKQVKYRMGDWYQKEIPPNPVVYGMDNLWINRFHINNEKRNLTIEPLGRCWTGYEPGRLGGVVNSFRDLINMAIFSCTELKFYVSGVDNFSRFDGDHFPVFAFNRRVEEPDVMLFQEWAQNDTVFKLFTIPSVKFDDKNPELVWRGIPTGSIFDRDRPFFQPRYWDVCEDYIIRKEYFDKNFDSLDDALSNFVRYRFVKKWGDKYNIGFSLKYNYWNDEVNTFHDPLYKGRIEWDDLVKYKYHLVLDGNDMPSSMPFTFFSKSVALMPIPEWEGVFHQGIKPWVHYVPIDRDGNDMEEKLEWCKDNDFQCKIIVNNAFNHIQKFTDRPTETAIHREILTRYVDNLIGGRGWKDWSGQGVNGWKPIKY